MSESDNPVFDIALSFAGEDRPFVAAVADTLIRQGYLVFYDRYYEQDLVGRDLVTYLRAIYADRSAHCAVFVSEHYRHKRWPNRVERQAILDRATRNDQLYLLPVVLDSAWLDGIPQTTGYIDARDRPAEDIARILAQAIGSPSLPSDEAEFFATLARDPLVLGRLLLTFRHAPLIERARYNTVTERMSELATFGDFLQSYGLCESDHNWDQGDCWMRVCLTDKGTRFLGYIRHSFLRPHRLPVETNIFGHPKLPKRQ